VRGFEPRNGGIKIRCLTTWRHPNTRAGRDAYNDVERVILSHLPRRKRGHQSGVGQIYRSSFHRALTGLGVVFCIRRMIPTFVMAVSPRSGAVQHRAAVLRTDGGHPSTFQNDF
jgi:hypothetical protein